MYASYAAWVRLRAWALVASIGPQDTLGTGWVQTLVAEWVGLLSVSLLLWAGMRLLRERGNHVLVLGGFAAWWFIAGHVIEQPFGATPTTLLLALFVVIGGLLSLLEFPTR